MKTKNIPKTYISPIIDSLIEDISSDELEKIETKMRLAIKIADAIEAIGLNKSQFAEKIGKNNSEISKWLSGTHNFTTDTLLLLEDNLPIKLVNSEIEENVILYDVNIVLRSSGHSTSRFNFQNLIDSNKLERYISYSLPA